MRTTRPTPESGDEAGAGSSGEAPSLVSSVSEASGALVSGSLAARSANNSRAMDGRVEVGDEFYLGEHGGIEGLDPEHTAQDRTRNRADCVGVAAQVRGVQQGTWRGLAREQCERHGDRVRRGHRRADLLDEALQGPTRPG